MVDSRGVNGVGGPQETPKPHNIQKQPPSSPKILEVVQGNLGTVIKYAKLNDQRKPVKSYLVTKDYKGGKADQIGRSAVPNYIKIK